MGALPRRRPIAQFARLSPAVPLALTGQLQKGFPTDIAQATIEEFWNGVSEKVKAVRLRRTFKEREQKDSCFVEFDSAEERDRVLGMELKHDETPLKLEAKYVMVREILRLCCCRSCCLWSLTSGSRLSSAWGELGYSPRASSSAALGRVWAFERIWE